MDCVTGLVTALKLPDYEPRREPCHLVSRLCSVLRGHRQRQNLYAVVAELAVRTAVVATRVGKFDPIRGASRRPVCGEAEWQREPLRVLFHPAGHEPASFDLVPGSTMLVEDSEDEKSAAIPAAKPEN